MHDESIGKLHESKSLEGVYFFIASFAVVLVVPFELFGPHVRFQSLGYVFAALYDDADIFKRLLPRPSMSALAALHVVYKLPAEWFHDLGIGSLADCIQKDSCELLHVVLLKRLRAAPPK